MEFYTSQGNGTNPTELYVIPFITAEGFNIVEFKQSDWGDKLHFTVRAKHEDGRQVTVNGSYGEEVLDNFFRITGIEDSASPLETDYCYNEAEAEYGDDADDYQEDDEREGTFEGLIHEVLRALGFQR